MAARNIAQLSDCAWRGRIPIADQCYCHHPNVGDRGRVMITQCTTCPVKELVRSIIPKRPIILPNTEIVTKKPTRRHKRCGCNKRKERLNQIAPSLKLGNKVETILKVTGIKSIVEKVIGQSEDGPVPEDSSGNLQESRDALELRDHNSP